MPGWDACKGTTERLTPAQVRADRYRQQRADHEQTLRALATTVEAFLDRQTTGRAEQLADASAAERRARARVEMFQPGGRAP